MGHKGVGRGGMKPTVKEDKLTVYRQTDRTTDRTTDRQKSRQTESLVEELLKLFSCMIFTLREVNEII